MTIFKLILRWIDSTTHILGLAGLGVVLVLLPIVGVHISSFFELIGGNYTNVISAIGACIAASAGTRSAVQHHYVRDEVKKLREALRLLSSSGKLETTVIDGVPYLHPMGAPPPNVVTRTPDE